MATELSGLVADVIDENTVVINRGQAHGVKKGQRWLIYQNTDREIRDPESGESLGFLEVTRGTGKVIHVQDVMATIRAEEPKTLSISTINILAGLTSPDDGFSKVKPGHKARLLSA